MAPNSRLARGVATRYLQRLRMASDDDHKVEELIAAAEDAHEAAKALHEEMAGTDDPGEHLMDALKLAEEILDAFETIDGGIVTVGDFQANLRNAKDDTTKLESELKKAKASAKRDEDATAVVEASTELAGELRKLKREIQSLEDEAEEIIAAEEDDDGDE